MDLQEFRKSFLEDVRSTAATSGDGSCASFVGIFADYLVGAEVLSNFEIAFYSGTGKRNRKLRTDGYVLDEFDYTMNLIIADYVGEDEERTLNRTEANQTFNQLLYFIDEALNYNLHKEIEISTPVADLVDLVRVNRTRIRKYRFLLLTDGFMSERIESLPINEIDGIPVEFQIWDISRLYKVCLSDMGREKIEIDFADYAPNGIPCLEANNVATNEYRCFLCVMPGEVLADVYDRYGGQLLEGNVRSFLSTKVAVNKKIRATILKEPAMFFAFNNGIASTAVDVAIETKPEGKFITYARDFQVINGGQTTASLSNARYKDKADISKIFVQMKLTEMNMVNPDETNEIIQKISRSSNSQNKVSDADFFSTHPFHIRMEQISRRLFAPAVGGAQNDTRWFYERARGQYFQAQMRMTKAEKNKFTIQNPKSQLITKTDLAKVRNCWRIMPNIVSKGAQTNFMAFAEWVDEEWSTDNNAFNELFFKESIALFILFKHMEKLVTHQPWYEQGYRANIVAYAISLLSYLIKKQYPGKKLDLQIIWNRQDVPKALSNQMGILSKYVMDAITDPGRETINVTQWCKREGCWSRIMTLPITLKENISSVLVNKEEAKSFEREAKKDQKVVSGIEAQTKVVEVGTESWNKLFLFVETKRIAGPDEMSALRVACQIPSKLPNSYQSQQLLALMEKAVFEGFKD